MEKKAFKTKTRIFTRAGYIVLTKILADGTESKKPEDIYTSDAAIIQSVTTKYSISSEKMEDGNSFFAAAEHATGVDASADVVFNTFDPKLWEFAAGAKSATVENDYYRDTAEQYKITANGIVKLNASALKPDSVVLARMADGTDFTMVKGAEPKRGEFTVDYETATLTFSKDDKDVGIYVTCYKRSALVTTASIPAIPKMAKFKLELIGENCDKDEVDNVADNFVISRVTLSGDIPQPPRQKNYGSVTYTFGIGKPGVGENAIDWKSAVKSERSADDAAPDATLSALSLGSISLFPAFSADVTEYTAETSNSTNTITATATDSKAAVEIKNGNTVVTSGSSATWSEGENTVTVKVTNGSAVKTYTIKVTKS